MHLWYSRRGRRCRRARAAERSLTKGMTIHDAVKLRQLVDTLEHDAIRMPWQGRRISFNLAHDLIYFVTH